MQDNVEHSWNGKALKDIKSRIEMQDANKKCSILKPETGTRLCYDNEGGAWSRGFWLFGGTITGAKYTKIPFLIVNSYTKEEIPLKVNLEIDWSYPGSSGVLVRAGVCARNQKWRWTPQISLKNTVGKDAAFAERSFSGMVIRVEAALQSTLGSIHVSVGFIEDGT
jgi:hypothetical protein